MSKCSASWAIVRSPLMAASATFALKAGVWFRRGRLFMVSPVRGDHRRFQAETPLIDLFKFAEPALYIAGVGIVDAVRDWRRGRRTASYIKGSDPQWLPRHRGQSDPAAATREREMFDLRSVPYKASHDLCIACVLSAHTLSLPKGGPPYQAIFAFAT